MTTLLIDGDTIVWKVLTMTDKKGEVVVHPDDGKLFFDRVVDGYVNTMKRYFEVTGTLLFLTPDDRSNFRYNLESEVGYKANRINVPKPVGFLEVKNAVRRHENCIEEYGLEADDLIAMHAHEYRDSACIVGIDKDYRQCTDTWLWDTRPETVPEYSTPLGYLVKRKHILRIKKDGKCEDTYKMYGRGAMWFYYQLLVGDSSDNIKGASGTGPIKAYELLKTCTSEKDLWNAIQEPYKKQGIERAIENAQLLWLKKSKDEAPWSPPSAS